MGVPQNLKRFYNKILVKNELINWPQYGIKRWTFTSTAAGYCKLDGIGNARDENTVKTILS